MKLNINDLTIHWENHDSENVAIILNEEDDDNFMSTFLVNVEELDLVISFLTFLKKSMINKNIKV